jgi:hypothetical protein
MKNENVLNVTLNDLPDQLKELVVTVVNQYQEKWLLSFSKNRDKKVFQKTLFPRVILEGEQDPSIQIQHNAMYETISKAMAATLANYNKILLNGISNAIKEAFSLDIQNRGPTYSVSPRNRQTFVGQTSGDHVSRELTNVNQRYNTVQQLVQQSILDYGHSATKVAPQSWRIARDFNAPPYQGRLTPGEVPPGYHYIAEHYTLNGDENPRY